MEQNKYYKLLFFFCFLVLGFTIGIIAGLSSSPIASALIPAILTLIGGFIVNSFSDKKNNTEIILFMVLLLCIGLLVGLWLGISCRNKYDLSQKIQDLELKTFEHELKKDLIEFEYNLNHNIKDTISIELMDEVK